jgi:hypothetical protein
MRLLLLIGGIFVVVWLHRPHSRADNEPAASPMAIAAVPAAQETIRPVPRGVAPAQPRVIDVRESQAALRAEAAPAPAKQPSDAEIAKRIIARSAVWSSEYCRCPEDTDKRGRRCRTRSLYSRDGQKILCYERDVTASMIEEFRRFRAGSPR